MGVHQKSPFSIFKESKLVVIEASPLYGSRRGETRIKKLKGKGKDGRKSFYL